MRRRDWDVVGTMTVYPAIDLRNGRCVRLRQGDPGRETVYGGDPVAVARRWAAEGAPALHVVDLDGALAGGPRQVEAVAAICAAVDLPVHVGGGLRTLADIDRLLAAGATRAVVGTKALSFAFLREAAARFGGRLLPALDCRGGIVAVGGWQRSSGIPLAEAAATVRAAGCQQVLYTDVGRDGMLAGPDLAGLAVLQAANLEVVASGGVGSVGDVRALAESGAAGVVIGRALYDGRIRLAEALEACA